MSASPRESYLEAEILTAPAHKLHFMLIDAAIRSIEQAQQLWKACQNDDACERIIRAQQIVTELLSSLNHEANAELAKKIAAIYFYVFRQLLEANLERSEEKLADALRVLQSERETWRQVCEKVGRTEQSGTVSGSAQGPGAALAGDHALPDEVPPGMSLEA